MIPNQPPACAALPIDRRSLIKGGLLGTGLLATPLRAQLGRGFTHGIASGEPGPDRVLLWTRYSAAAPAKLRFEVAEGLDFARPVTGGEVMAGPESDWCAKAWATGLAPDRWYYYRFIAPDGTMSDVGRTRTLPVGPTERFRMAVFSCSNIGFGWFNAYAHAAEEGAFDLAVHLGDYYYEYKLGVYPGEKELVAGRAPEPANEIVSLADYRQRHAEYRTDRDLQRLTQIYPLIMVWDDHETANDSWQGGAENHQPETEGPWDVRKAAAMRAYHEWLPVSDEPWKRYDIGDLASVFRLETRLTARSKQFELSEVTAGVPSDQVAAKLEAFRKGEWQDPSRELMGPQQQQWLAQGLTDSVRSGRKWQILAQQVVMGSLVMPGDLIEGLTGEVPDYVRRRLLEAAAASAAGLPFNMDAWDGYPAARQRLLDAARAADANLVVLSGDSHNAWACELGGAGVEFAGHSVTSPGAESSLPWKRPDALARELVTANADLEWCETARRGYLALELTPARATGEFRFLDTVRSRTTALASSHRLAADFGARKFAGLSG